MKSFHFLTIIAFCFALSCSPPVDYSTLPVVLPEDAEHEPYYVRTTSLHSQLKTKGIAFVKFQFKGSIIPPTRHNLNQAKAIAWATQQPDTAQDQYNLSIYGEKASDLKRIPLSEHLSTNGVDLRRIQILQVKQSSNDLVVENALENRKANSDLIAVAIKKL